MPKKRKRGPKADRLILLPSNWKAAVKKAIKKKRPSLGWPKPEKGTPEKSET